MTHVVAVVLLPLGTGETARLNALRETVGAGLPKMTKDAPTTRRRSRKYMFTGPKGQRRPVRAMLLGKEPSVA